tara:strand:- start:39411 stop:39584 length:174 start_codon:yes stop_codon:yes gene_type:complete
VAVSNLFNAERSRIDNPAIIACNMTKGGGTEVCAALHLGDIDNAHVGARNNCAIVSQ